MFKLDLKEYREPRHRLSDYLPWALLVDEGIVQAKTGALMRVLAYRGHDVSTHTPEERVAQHDRLNRALQSLGAGWALHVEAQRVRCEEYLRAEAGGALVRLIDEVRRQNFTCEGALYETRYYLTLTWAPRQGPLKKLGERLADLFGGLFDGGAVLEDAQRRRAEALEYFQRMTREFSDRCADLFAEARWLGDDEVLTYLHSTISTRRHPIRCPAVPMYLDAILADEAAALGLEGRLGRHHLRVVSVKGYADRTHPDFLRLLESCPFELRVVTRFIALGADEARRELSRYENLFYAQREKLSSALLGDGPGQGPRNEAAVAASHEVGQVARQVGQGHIALGYHSMSVVLWAEDHEVCRARAEQVMAMLRRQGMACVDEAANLRSAWLATHPGNVWSNPRRALVSSRNLAHMLPTSARWTGQARSTHIGRAPHVYTRGRDGSPFRLNLNVDDVGHAMILGPTGAGKSTLLGLLELQWMKYPDAQVFIFDRGRSSRAATLAAGGQFVELSVERPEVTFQPLARLDEPAEAEFAQGWCEDICALEGVEVDTRHRRAIHQALMSMRASPVHLRTMGAFTLALQDRALRRVFEPFTTRGPHGALWDHREERLGLGAWTAFEMGALMDAHPRLVMTTLRYLFHRVEQRLDGAPTLLVLDEAWLFLDHPVFAARLGQWLRELRKQRVYVVFATQNITDALEGALATTLQQNCATQILLPNPRALTPALRALYARLGLGEGEIELLARAQPRREYLLRNAHGARLFELGLSEVELALVGASSPDDHARIDAACAQAQSSPGSFAHHYLRLSGFSRLAAQLP